MGTAKEAKPTDDELQAIARLRQGDIGGLEVLVLRYQLEAVRTAYLICYDCVLAEDIAQATFLRVYERITQFDTSRPFGPWFLRIVVNNTLQAMRQQARTTSIDDERLQDHDGNVGEWLAGFVPSLEDKLDQLDTNEALAAALTQLPPDQRAAVVLHYYLGLSMEEISERLDCTSGTARWRVHRGRQRLRRILEPFWRATRQGHGSANGTGSTGSTSSGTDAQAASAQPKQTLGERGKAKALLGVDLSGIPSYTEKGDL